MSLLLVAGWDVTFNNWTVSVDIKLKGANVSMVNRNILNGEFKGPRISRIFCTPESWMKNPGYS